MVWHEATVFIFLRKFLLLAFKHGVQGQADDCRVGKRTHTQEISPHILKIGPLPVAPPPPSRLEAACAATNWPPRYGRLNRVSEEETKDCHSGGDLVGKVWCGVALFRHSLV